MLLILCCSEELDFAKKLPWKLLDIIDCNKIQTFTF